MLVIELTDDKYGKAMHDIVCIEDKLSEIKKIFEEETYSGNFRRYGYNEDDRYYEVRDKDYRQQLKTRDYDKKYM